MIGWACEIRPWISDSDYPMNVKICQLLTIVQQTYDAKKHNFRANGYQKAIAKIRSITYEILTIDDVRQLAMENSIGARITLKIKEIVTTGRLLQAEAVLNNSDDTAVRTLCDVWGIGPVKAMSLVTQGIKSIAQLRHAANTDVQLLDKNQNIGLRLYEDLLCRIPRNEVQELELYVRRAVKHIDTSIDITVAGSYLRGKNTCGDVDILVHGPTDRLKQAFPRLKNNMRRSGVLTDDLIDGADKYFGVFKFPGRRHGRIDLFAVPSEQYPYALLTYTGSAIFNRYVQTPLEYSAILT